MKSVIFKPIGIIHSPTKTLEDAPRSEKTAEGVEATVEVFPEYKQGLSDLAGFSHIILITHFHLSKDYSLMANPPLDNQPRGVFATRSPRRPNGIGMSTARLKKIESNILYISNTEMVDGTPVLDIKPYIPLKYLKNDQIKLGWLEGKI